MMWRRREHQSELGVGEQVMMMMTIVKMMMLGVMGSPG